MSEDKPDKLQKVKGRLTLRTFARTTKSESLGVYLETENDCFLIRPASGNPFMNNPLAELAGKYIEATGRRSSYVFFATKWREIPEPK
ncbi:hypothetical protein [Chitinophaga deserti]|uniref:hypothetical protein n=1 Tax=Chitinophaga deserti TaxID=2164099 RepID=UPI000D6B1F89|nr:hypothetical protein [Chitinophaga deserti]